LIKHNEKEFASTLTEFRVNLDNHLLSKDKFLALIRLGDILLLLNDDSHVRIMVCSKDVKEGGEINELNNIYNELKTFTNNLEKYLQFEYNNKYGYANKNPNFLGLSGKFYAEVDCPALVSDTEFFNDLKNNLLLKTQSKYAKFGSIEALSENCFKIELYSIISQSEQEFLEEIFSKFYNIDFLVNYKETSQSHWLLEKLNFENLKAQNPINTYLLHENFHIEKTYEKVYPVYKHLIYPNNLNLNTLIHQIINNNVSNKSFAVFRFFFETLFNNFSANNSLNSKNFKPLKIPLADEPIVNSLNYNPFAYPFAGEEYRINKSLSFDESFKKRLLKIFDLNANNSKVNQAVKSFRIKLHRNFQNFDLPKFLNEDQKKQIAAMITETLDGVSDQIELVNENLILDKNFKIHVNASDHLVLEYNSDFKTKDSVDRLVNFIKSFKQLSHKAEYKKYYFAVINNVGYRLSDFSLLASGLDFSIELDLAGLEPKTLDKEFSLYRNKYPVGPLAINIDELSNTIKIENDKKFQNYFNYMSLANILDRVLELIGNLKVIDKVEVVQKEIREEIKKVDDVFLNAAEDNSNNSKTDSPPTTLNAESINLNEVTSENLNSPININISTNNLHDAENLGNSGIFKDSLNNENNLSYEGSSIHLNDSKVSDKADDKYKINFENSAVNVSRVNDKKIHEEDDILIE